MGLDSVELLVAIEEEFNLEISDADAESLTTTGLVLDYILRARSTDGSSEIAGSESQIWERLRRLVALQLGIDPSTVMKDARFVEDLGVD